MTKKEYTKKEYMKKHLPQIIILGVFLALAVAYITIPSVRVFGYKIFTLFASMDVEVVAEYIRSYGIYAMIISFFLMMFQSIAAPLPAFLITFANAAIFGWWQGALLSWTSAMAGAAMCFYISRILGRDVVEKMTSKFAMESIDGFFERYGKHTIVICRLLPFVSFDYVSYAAGLTSMGFASFFVATGIGQLPATIVYSYVGGMLTGGVRMLVTALLLLFALSVFVVLVKKIYTEKQKGKQIE